jgi:hypothetical protein
MRRAHFAAVAALILVAALAWNSSAQAARPAQSPQESQTDQQAQQAESTAIKAARDPAVVATIKKAAEAQGDISPYTLKALEHDPKALEAVGRPAPAAEQAKPSGGSGATPKSTKAIYGDIIIHR